MFKVRKYPKTGTSSAEKYYYADLEIRTFLKWITFMAGSIDNMRSVALKALGQSQDDDEGVMVNELAKNRLILLHMLHSRIIDNYLTYLSEVLVECFLAKPEAMRSSEKIEISEVLQYSDYESIIAHVADKKVHSLSYQSIIDLEDFFSQRFGLNLYEEKNKKFFVKAIETRNIIAHNRGIQNSLYVKKVDDSSSVVGKIRDIGIDYSDKVNLMLYDNVKRLDKSLRKKLKVPGKRFDIQGAFSDRL